MPSASTSRVREREREEESWLEEEKHGWREEKIEINIEMKKKKSQVGATEERAQCAI